MIVAWKGPVNCRWVYYAARVGSLIFFFKKTSFFKIAVFLFSNIAIYKASCPSKMDSSSLPHISKLLIVLQ